MMHWRITRRMYGTRKQLDVDRVLEIQTRSFLLAPHTIYRRWFRSVECVGCNVADWGISKPFPDILEAQRPDGPFALHLSGGVDSSVLAKLYDSPDAHYFTGTVAGGNPAEWLAAQRFVADAGLTGTHHHVCVEPEDALRIANEMLPTMLEPHMDGAAVLSYACSREAKRLGLDTVLAGDNVHAFSDFCSWGPGETLTMVVWKTIEPAEMLGLAVQLPFAVPALVEWGVNTLTKQQRANKHFLRTYAEIIGVPPATAWRRNAGWQGHYDWVKGDVATAMRDTIKASPFKDIVGWDERQSARGLFRKYSLVLWLEANE